MDGNPVLVRIHSERGLAGKLGKELGITREAVSMWRRVPPKHALRVASFLDMPIEIVCPEIVPEPPRRKRRRSQ